MHRPSCTGSLCPCRRTRQGRGPFFFRYQGNGSWRRCFGAPMEFDGGDAEASFGRRRPVEVLGTALVPSLLDGFRQVLNAHPALGLRQRLLDVGDEGIVASPGDSLAPRPGDPAATPGGKQGLAAQSDDLVVENGVSTCAFSSASLLHPTPASPAWRALGWG